MGQDKRHKDGKHDTGRPSIYSEETAGTICELIAGGKSLVSICERSDMPGYRTVMRWVEDREDFRVSYQQAKKDQADYIAEEILSIADDSSLDIGFTEDGKPFVNGENIQRAKLRIDARKWYASKLAPKKYGDRIQQDVELETGDGLSQLLRELDGTTKSLISGDD